MIVIESAISPSATNRFHGDLRSTTPPWIVTDAYCVELPHIYKHECMYIERCGGAGRSNLENETIETIEGTKVRELMLSAIVFKHI